MTVAPKEGLGYVYILIMTDTKDEFPMDSTEHRFKIGPSKHPMKRLSQFLTSNLDITIVTAKKVNKRLESEKSVHKALKDKHIKLEWFKGSLEEIMCLQVVSIINFFI